jgi:aminopeptidase YwaD
MSPTPSIGRRELLAGAGALAGLATVSAPAGTAFAGTAGTQLTHGDRAVVSRISVNQALGHLSHLTREIGPRIGGTASEVRAARYIGRELRDLGYHVTLQPFAAVDKRLADLCFSGNEPWQAIASPEGAVGGRLTARVIDGKAGGETDYPENASGKIVLLDRGSAEQGDADSSIRVGRAVQRGAAAVLLVNFSTVAGRKAGTFNPRLPTTAAVAVPVIGLAPYHGERIRARLATGRRSTLELTTTLHAGLTSYNVLAERPATRPNPDGKVVMISSHYDSVPGAPGANDDGSGTVLCMELARVLRNLPTSAALRFAWWGSEEYGLIGSTHYVSGLDDPAAGQILGCFQNDMVGTSWDLAVVYYLLSVDGLHNTVTQAVADSAGRLGYAEVTGPVARGSSDHVPFHDRGIAAANHSWRGAGGPAELEPVYHTPEDTIENNVSRTRLRKSMELIGTAAYDVATRA